MTTQSDVVSENGMLEHVPAHPALAVRGLSASYGRGVVLRDVDLDVPAGGVVALLGPNGAGKTTLMRVAAGLLQPATGSVHLGHRNVTRWAPFKRRRSGLCLVPEGRGIFPNLSVRENLLVQVRGPERRAALDRVLTSFPDLASRLGQTAGSMSGGQQQMLALARCYLRESAVVLVDEASMGLAPLVVDEVYEALDQMRRDGCALLIVEQYVDRVLALADVVYVLEHGSAVRLGAPSDIDRDDLMDRYLDAAAAEVTHTTPAPADRSGRLGDQGRH